MKMRESQEGAKSTGTESGRHEQVKRFCGGAGCPVERRRTSLRRLRGIPAPDSTPDLRQQAEGQLLALLRAEGLPVRGVYRPGEVCRLLRISPTTLRQFCELTEHPSVRNPDPHALASFLVGCHHRVSKDALVDWLVGQTACLSPLRSTSGFGIGR